MVTPEVDTSKLPHRDDCIRPPREDNPLYPLPPDYESMEEGTQGWWRVNACCIQDTAEDFLEAWAFFFNTYLYPEEAMFLENTRESPKFHYQFVFDIAAFRLNALAAPRGACKSTLIRSIDMLMALTKRGYRIGNVFSIQKICRRSLSKMRRQFESNPLLLRDFGKMAPSRSSGHSWSADELELAPPFRSYIWGMWLQGQSRSNRFDWLAIDDAEFDPETQQVVPELVKKLEEQIHRVFMPMIELTSEDLDSPAIGRRGAGIALVGTVIQENMYLCRVVDAKPGSKYDFWSKWRLTQKTSDGRFLWGKRWGSKATDLMCEVMGADAFASEQLNEPGRLSSGRFRIDPLYTTYAIEQTDDQMAFDPCESTSIVRWSTRTPEGLPDERSLPVWEWLQGMDRAILVDWADTDRISATSDYTVLHVLGNDGESCIWSLDLVMGRMTTDEAANKVIELCMKWRPTRLAMESVGGYGKLTDIVTQAAYKVLLDRLGYVPIPYKLMYNSRRQSKGTRIDRIAWRFALDKIRFPRHRQAEPAYAECWHQVQDFTIDLKKLRYDDIVDTLGFVPEVFRGPGGRPVRTNPYEGMGVVQMIEAGKILTDDGFPLVEALPSYSYLTPKAAAALEAAEERNAHESRFNRPRRWVSSRPR